MIIEGIAVSMLANAIGEALKLFMVDMPEEYEKNNLEAFKAYIVEKNQNELVLKLDELLSLAQRSEIDTTGHGLKLDRMLEISQKMSRDVEEILKNVQTAEPEIEFFLEINGLCRKQWLNTDEEFAITLVPSIKNLSKIALENVAIKYHLTPSLDFSYHWMKIKFSNNEEDNPMFIQLSHPLFYNQEFAPVTCEIKLNSEVIEDMKKAELRVELFHKQGEQITKVFKLLDYVEFSEKGVRQSDKHGSTN